MRRLVDEAYEHCHATLTRNRALLDAVTDSLVEKETLGADEIEVRPRRRPRCISAAGDLGRSREAVCSISALSLRVPSTLLARLCGRDTLSLPTRAAPLAAPTDSGRTAFRRRRRGRSRAGASQCASGPREEGRRRAPSMASSGVWQGMGVSSCGRVLYPVARAKRPVASPVSARPGTWLAAVVYAELDCLCVEC